MEPIAKDDNNRPNNSCIECGRTFKEKYIHMGICGAMTGENEKAVRNDMKNISVRPQFRRLNVENNTRRYVRQRAGEIRLGTVTDT